MNRKNKKAETTIDYSKLPPECDQLCKWRSCLQKGENKGAYTLGRGYTNYYEKPGYVCITRLLHGCYAGKPGRGQIPDFEAMVREFEADCRNAKISQKARRTWGKQLWALNLILKDYVNVKGDQHDPR